MDRRSGGNKAGAGYKAATVTRDRRPVSAVFLSVKKEAVATVTSVGRNTEYG